MMSYSSQKGLYSVGLILNRDQKSISLVGVDWDTAPGFLVCHCGLWSDTACHLGVYGLSLRKIPCHGEKYTYSYGKNII